MTAKRPKPPKPPKPLTPAKLAKLARADWAHLIRGFADAGALAEAATGPAREMIDRMLARAARDGAQALAWHGARLALPGLTAGAGRRGRERFAARAELAAAPAEIPVAFAQIHRAFTGETDRGPALVAMFLEAGRKAEALVEQLQLASQADAALAPAARALVRALPRARLLPFRPRVRTLADFDRVRATGYVDGAPGRIAEVARAGLAWHGNVLRKADVIVSEAPP